MEVFIIIVAIVAVVAALLLLLLLQLRIKKHASDGSVTQTSSEPSFSEIAAADPNDPYYKNGPPPYREVMKSPELYPLSSSDNFTFGEAKIQISSQPCPGNERSKRTWAQLMTAVLRQDDLVPATSPEKRITSSIRNSFPPALRNSSEGRTKNVNDSNTSELETPTGDEELPSYHEVCLTGSTSGLSSTDQDNHSMHCSESGLRQGNMPGYNDRIERTNLNNTDTIFTVSSRLQTVIVEVEMSRSRSTTM